MVRRSVKSAFTLVELLVVIGIIAVLISMLLPALNRARQQAVSAQCMAQLKQVGNALLMYANDNGGWFPPGCGTNGPSGTLEKFLNYTTGQNTQAVRLEMARYLGITNPVLSNTKPISVKVLYCPADDQATNWPDTQFLTDPSGGQDSGKFRYWYVGNPWGNENSNMIKNKQDPDVASAIYWYDIDGEVDGSGNQIVRPGVEYLRKTTDKHQTDVAVMVDRSKQLNNFTGKWYYLHGDPTKPASAWKNELFGDGHCQEVRAGNPNDQTPFSIEDHGRARPRWGKNTSNPAGW